MPMNAAYLNLTADAGGSAITHIALVDPLGAEVVGGGYARQPVTWTAAVDGLIRPTMDLEFSVAAGAEVAGWRGYTALIAGTEYGGADFPAVSFTAAGTFVLLAASTSIDHDAV